MLLCLSVAYLHIHKRSSASVVCFNYQSISKFSLLPVLMTYWLGLHSSTSKMLRDRSVVLCIFISHRVNEGNAMKTRKCSLSRFESVVQVFTPSSVFLSRDWEISMEIPISIMVRLHIFLCS